MLYSCHLGLHTQPPSHLSWSTLGELGLCSIWYQGSWLRVAREFALGHKACEWLRGNLNPGLLIPTLGALCSCSQSWELLSYQSTKEERVLLHVAGETVRCPVEASSLTYLELFSIFWATYLCLFVLSGFYVCTVEFYCFLWLWRRQFLVSQK